MILLTGADTKEIIKGTRSVELAHSLMAIKRNGTRDNGIETSQMVRESSLLTMYQAECVMLFMELGNKKSNQKDDLVNYYFSQ